MDDVTDTDMTLKLDVDYLGKFEPEEIKTAVLHQHKICSDIVPDYYAKKIVSWRWIIYPWNAYEDLMGFTKNIIDNRTLTAKQICNELHTRYNINIAESDLMETIEELNERMYKAYRK